MSRHTYVNNLFQEMRNTHKQDLTDPLVWNQLPGRTIIIETDIAANLPLIDPGGNAFQAALDKNTTHITWSVEGGVIWVTFDGSDPDTESSTTARHALNSTDLGTMWSADLVRQVRMSINSGTPKFIYTEMATK